MIILTIPLKLKILLILNEELDPSDELGDFLSSSSYSLLFGSGLPLFKFVLFISSAVHFFEFFVHLALGKVHKLVN